MRILQELLAASCSRLLCHVSRRFEIGHECPAASPLPDVRQPRQGAWIVRHVPLCRLAGRGGRSGNRGRVDCSRAAHALSTARTQAAERFRQEVGEGARKGCTWSIAWCQPVEVSPCLPPFPESRLSTCKSCWPRACVRKGSRFWRASAYRRCAEWRLAAARRPITPIPPSTTG